MAAKVKIQRIVQADTKRFGSISQNLYICSSVIKLGRIKHKKKKGYKYIHGP